MYRPRNPNVRDPYVVRSASPIPIGAEMVGQKWSKLGDAIAAAHSVNRAGNIIFCWNLFRDDAFRAFDQAPRIDTTSMNLPFIEALRRQYKDWRQDCAS